MVEILTELGEFGLMSANMRGTVSTSLMLPVRRRCARAADGWFIECTCAPVNSIS